MIKNALTVILSAATVWACLLGSAALHAQAPHRFGFDCDGNWFDRDDFAGSAISLHIIRNSGQSHRLAFYGINNHFSETRSSWEKEMRKSTTLGPWAHPAIVDCRATNGRANAISKLRAVLMASTANNTYWHGMQGPPDIFYEAHRGVPASALQHVRLISHKSKYNEFDGGQRDWTDIRYVQREQLPSGNINLNTKQNWGPWNGWMNQFDRDRLQAVGRADCSDATEAGYIVHGKRQSTISDLKLWVGQ